MHGSPTCVTCGFPIGDRAGLFEAAREKAVREALREADVAPPQAQLAGVEIRLGAILDALWIVGPCCRIHMMTAMDYKATCASG